MSGTRARRVLGVIAAAVCGGVLLLAGHREQSPRRRPVAKVVGARRSPRATAAAPLRRREALRVARRFARAYAAWDAGRRDAGPARDLTRSATPELLGSLGETYARPVVRSAAPLRLAPLGAYRAGPAYLVALARSAGGRHVITLRVLATPGGARVAGIER